MELVLNAIEDEIADRKRELAILENSLEQLRNIKTSRNGNTLPAIVKPGDFPEARLSQAIRRYMTSREPYPVTREELFGVFKAAERNMGTYPKRTLENGLAHLIKTEVIEEKQEKFYLRKSLDTTS
jgi:hypothetical protein